MSDWIWVNLKMPPDLKEKLAELAKSTGKSNSSLIRDLILLEWESRTRVTDNPRNN